MASGPARKRDRGAGDERRLRQVVGEAPALDKVIHERMRLGIVSALAVNDALSFAELKELLGMTDGNLSVHARRLEEAGYVRCKKTFEGRTPRTDYRITAKGRRALQGYLAHMEALIQTVRRSDA